MDFPALSEAELLSEQPYNAASKKQVNDARKKEARLRREELDFVRIIMSTKQGRKWMNNLIIECKSWGNPIVPGDVNLTYANLGSQNIGKKLFQDIGEASPDEYIIMIKEARGSK